MGRDMETATEHHPGEILSDTLDCAQTWTVQIVEWNKHLVAYIIFLVLIFIALWIAGFVDTKVFASVLKPKR
jgi:hypothetical protein